MGDIFNLSNLLLLVLAIMIGYSFWSPFIKGKKIKAQVDGYCHPQTGKDGDLEWCVRFVYREQKAGKRLYCNSRKRYDTKEEAKAKYPKGTEVEIRYYEDNTDGMLAIVRGDKDEIKYSLIYTVLIVVAAIGIASIYNVIANALG